MEVTDLYPEAFGKKIVLDEDAKTVKTTVNQVRDSACDLVYVTAHVNRALMYQNCLLFPNTPASEPVKANSNKDADESSAYASGLIKGLII